jgi:hypothetical protein
MAPHQKIEYVIFDMDGTPDQSLLIRPTLRQSIHAGLMIDSERVYTDVTSN